MRSLMTIGSEMEKKHYYLDKLITTTRTMFVAIGNPFRALKKCIA